MTLGIDGTGATVSGAGSNDPAAGPPQVPPPATPPGTTSGPANRPLLILAAICLAIPVVALMWVGSYAQDGPELGSIPFFFWYQFLWVFLTSAFTYAAHRLVLAARGQRERVDGVAR